MKEVYHPDFIKLDIPRLKAIFTQPEYEELMFCLEKAITDIKRRPSLEGKKLEYPPLEHFKKKKFHSTRRPARKNKPNMRLIFRIDGDELLLLGLGIRRQQQVDDIYQLLKPRDQDMWLRRPNP